MARDHHRPSAPGSATPGGSLAGVRLRVLGTSGGWPAAAAVGKTLVSSSMIDRVTDGLDRRLLEVPVGFKWFVPGRSCSATRP